MSGAWENFGKFVSGGISYVNNEKCDTTHHRIFGFNSNFFVILDTTLEILHWEHTYSILIEDVKLLDTNTTNDFLCNKLNCSSIRGRALLMHKFDSYI